MILNILIYMPCANGLVYLFDDLSHPAVALMCIRNIQRVLSAAQAASLDGLIEWLKATRQQASVGASSILSTSWASMQNDDVALHQWGLGRHDMMLPPLPMTEPISVTSSPAGLTESKARTMIREEARAARETKSSRAGCHRVMHLE